MLFEVIASSVSKTGSRTLYSTFILRHASIACSSVSAAIQDVDGFVNKLSSTIKVGEETGMLGPMLESVANDLDFYSEQALMRLTSLIEPVMIVVMAVVVGFIMISIIQPIYQSYSSIGAGS